MIENTWNPIGKFNLRLSTLLNVIYYLDLDSQNIFDKSLPTNENVYNNGYSYYLCEQNPAFINKNYTSCYEKDIETYIKNNYWLWNSDDSYYKSKNSSEFTFKIKIPRVDKEYSMQSEKSDLTKSKHIVNKVKTELEESKLSSTSTALVDEDDCPLILKSVEEVLNSKVLKDAVKSCPNYGVTKRRLYRLRPDVVIKVILRWMRKYYLKDFKSFFDFTRCNKSNNSDSSGELINQINKYLSNKFRDACMANLGIYFISIISLKDKFISISEENKELYNSINEIAYYFNKPKFSNLMNTPQFVLLLLEFLSKHDILKTVIKNPNDAEIIQAYSEQIRILKLKWMMTLNM